MARDENLTPALHLHHKGDELKALQLIRAGLIAGVTEFDSSIGGLGGCPFAEGSGANLSTETLVRHLNSWGIDCGLDEVSLGKASKIAWKIKNKSAIAI
jgi:hydroxymethylglutaryl-CoA lyase